MKYGTLKLSQPKRMCLLATHNLNLVQGHGGNVRPAFSTVWPALKGESPLSTFLSICLLSRIVCRLSRTLLVDPMTIESQPYILHSVTQLL